MESTSLTEQIILTQLLKSCHPNPLRNNGSGPDRVWTGLGRSKSKPPKQQRLSQTDRGPFNSNSHVQKKHGIICDSFPSRLAPNTARLPSGPSTIHFRCAVDRVDATSLQIPRNLKLLTASYPFHEILYRAFFRLPTQWYLGTSLIHNICTPPSNIFDSLTLVYVSDSLFFLHRY